MPGPPNRYASQPATASALDRGATSVTAGSGTVHKGSERVRHDRRRRCTHGRCSRRCRAPGTAGRRGLPELPELSRDLPADYAGSHLDQGAISARAVGRRHALAGKETDQLEPVGVEGGLAQRPLFPRIPVAGELKTVEPSAPPGPPRQSLAAWLKTSYNW